MAWAELNHSDSLQGGETHVIGPSLAMGFQRTTRAQVCRNTGQTPGTVLQGQDAVWATSNADTSRPLSPSLGFSDRNSLTSIRLAKGPRSCCITGPTCSHRSTVSHCDPSLLASHPSAGPEEDTHSKRLGTAVYSSSKASIGAAPPNFHCRCSSVMLRSHKLTRPPS